MLRDIFEEKTVQKKLFRTLLQGILLASVTIAFSEVSLAQDAEREVRPDRGAINVPCCQCGKGGATVIDLSTGVAPWVSPQGSIQAISVYPGWKTSNPPAKWIYTGSNAASTFTYNLKINIPKNCNIAPKVSFAGTGWGDNNITISLDDRVLGTTPVSSAGQANYGFRDPYGVNVNGTLSAGSHTLSVTVRNDDSVTGFLFDGKLKIECPPADNPYNSGNQPQY